MDIFQKSITPDKPRVLAEEQIYVYVPVATSTNAGIARYNRDQFDVIGSEVSLKWPAESFAQGPIETPSMVKVLDNEFEYTGNTVDLISGNSKISSNKLEVRLKRILRDAYERPELIMLDPNYFVRTIVEKDGKQYYKHQTTAVHYNMSQNLSNNEQAQARLNIGAGSLAAVNESNNNANIALARSADAEEIAEQSDLTSKEAKRLAQDALDQIKYNLGTRVTVNGEWVQTFDADSKADIEYVDNRVAALVGTAPETLDTLEELAIALSQNANVVDALNNAINTKLRKATHATTYDEVYTKAKDGLQILSIVSDTPLKERYIVQADHWGEIHVKDPIFNYNPATKRYVDKAFDNVKDINVNEFEKDYVAGYSATELSNVTTWTKVTSPSGFTARQRSCCYGNGYYVIAGTSGQIAYSKDAINWVNGTSFSSAVVTGLAYGNGWFLAVDSNGYIYRTDDPSKTWTPVYQNPIIIESIRYVNNKYYAVGQQGFIGYSFDGQKWTQATVDTTNTFIDIGYGNGKYIAVGHAGTVFTSVNGITWYNKSIEGYTTDIRAVYYANGNFVIGTSGGRIDYSEDGETWTQANNPSSLSVNWIRNFTYHNNRLYVVMYVSTGQGEIWVSKDKGKTWSVEFTPTGTSRLWCVCSGNDKFIASGDNGNIFVLDMNLNWQDKPVETNYQWYRFKLSQNDGSIIYSDAYYNKPVNDIVLLNANFGIIVRDFNLLKENVDNLGNIYATKDEAATKDEVAIINTKIPTAASATNQLADKEFVNSSIATNTATFRGTYNYYITLPSTGVDINDYAFVKSVDNAGNTKYSRYKFDGTRWNFEYELNNSSFTAAQWSTINSGITAELLSNLATKEYVTENGGKINSISVNGTPQTIDANKNVNIEIVTEETDPTVPAWAKAATKPTYKYNEILETPTIPSIEGLASEEYVNNLVNPLQTSIANKVNNTTTINGKALSTNITLTAGDVSALPDNTAYGASLSLTMNTSTYVVTAQLKDQNGNNLGTAQTIDLPLESVVVSGSYDTINKKVILTLKDGSTVEFSVADLVDGLASQSSVDAKYTKPSTGIPKSDLASTVRASLDKADTALQEVPSEYITETELTAKGYATKDEIPSIEGLATELYVQNAVSDKATTTYVDTKISDLVGSAPETLDTLAELSTALKNDKDIVTVLENSIASKANSSDLAGYLPLTAGSSKPLTDDLYITSGKYIRLGNHAFIRGDDADGRLTISAGKDRILTIRPNPDNSTGQMHIYGTVFRPGSKDGVQLGTDSAPWSAIYGTTLYQDGKQVANKEEIPTVNNATLTIQKNGTNVGTFTANASSNSTINITVPTGAAADKGVVTTVDTSANLPTSNAVKTFVEGKGYITSSGTAANATKLNNQNASYYLDYNNFINKPTIPEVISVASIGATITSAQFTKLKNNEAVLKLETSGAIFHVNQVVSNSRILLTSDTTTYSEAVSNTVAYSYGIDVVLNSSGSSATMTQYGVKLALDTRVDSVVNELVSVKNNYVTTNTAQTISGAKTFTAENNKFTKALILGDPTPMMFTGYGTGTYNKAAFVCNTTDKFGVECPRETDSGSAAIVPFRIGVRGGQLGNLVTGTATITNWTMSQDSSGNLVFTYA